VKSPLKIIPANPLHQEVSACAFAYCASREEKIDAAELRKFGSELMVAVSQACMGRGAKVIGHIKAYIEHQTGFLHANTVGEPSDITVDGRDGEPTNHITLVVNSIVYGFPEESLKETTKEAIEAVFDRFSMKWSVMRSGPDDSA
jgi:hypothetical protein